MTIVTFITNIGIFLADVILPLLFAIAFVVFLWNIAKYFVIESDSSGAREKAKQVAIYGILAFVFLTGIWGFLNVILGSISSETGTLLNRQAFICPDIFGEGCVVRSYNDFAGSGGAFTDPLQRNAVALDFLRGDLRDTDPFERRHAESQATLRNTFARIPVSDGELDTLFSTSNSETAKLAELDELYLAGKINDEQYDAFIDLINEGRQITGEGQIIKQKPDGPGDIIQSEIEAGTVSKEVTFKEIHNFILNNKATEEDIRLYKELSSEDLVDEVRENLLSENERKLSELHISNDGVSFSPNSDMTITELQTELNKLGLDESSDAYFAAAQLIYERDTLLTGGNSDLLPTIPDSVFNGEKTIDDVLFEQLQSTPEEAVSIKTTETVAGIQLPIIAETVATSDKTRAYNKMADILSSKVATGELSGNDALLAVNTLNSITVHNGDTDAQIRALARLKNNGYISKEVTDEYYRLITGSEPPAGDLPSPPASIENRALDAQIEALTKEYTAGGMSDEVYVERLENLRSTRTN